MSLDMFTAIRTLYIGMYCNGSLQTNDSDRQSEGVSTYHSHASPMHLVPEDPSHA